jgi:nucleotide-binding universal stress UspA family protein
MEVPMITQELTLERPQELRRELVKSSTLKTILVHVQDDGTLDSRIEAALSLARASSAHVSLLHVTPIQAYVAFDSLGGVFVMNDVMKAIDEQESSLRTRVEAKLQSEDVSWDYEQQTGDVVANIASHAVLADLVVVGRHRHRDDSDTPATSLLGDLLHSSRSPMFIPGDGADAVDPTGVALIAWDGSYEAANAVRSSIGLLKIAEAVRIVQVTEDKHESFPSTRLLEYLARQGISAELAIRHPPAHGNDVIAATLVEEARVCGASYLVMGGYSRSRVTEYVFGGVTRELLEACPTALVIAH